MIERKLLAEKMKAFEIKSFVDKVLRNIGQSNVQVKKTPLGEKIIITASRPGLVVGRKGENIKLLTESLKKRFQLENPQIEIEELDVPDLDPKIIAERVSMTLERYGSARFKGVGHKVLEAVLRAGALGAEVLISGKIPSSRAKRWRFYQGYLKKSGHIAQEGVRTAYMTAELKTGTVGIQVRILPSTIELPDKITLREEKEVLTEEEALEQAKEVTEKDAKEEKEDKKTEEKAPKKKAAKKEDKKAAEKKDTKEAKKSDKESKTEEQA